MSKVSIWNLFKKNNWILIVYLIPVFGVIAFVNTLGVNVPFWDEWESVDLFTRVQENRLSFGDLFRQHNEHRILFPKIIFIILAFISDWNLQLEMYVSVVLALISFGLIYQISKSSGAFLQNQNLFHLFNITSGFYIFSLFQHENWLWGFQIAWFFIVMCFLLALFFLRVPQKLSPRYKLGAAAIFSFIASFSSAHGLLSWLALIPSVISLQGNKKQKILRLVTWLFLFSVSVTIYSLGYHKPSPNTNFGFIFQEPLQAVRYFFWIISSSIYSLGHNRAEMGVLLLVIFLFFNIYAIKHYYSELYLYLAPWISLGWFSLLFALLTTVGRAGMGPSGIAPRYTTMSVLLIVACLQIFLMLISSQTLKLKNTYKNLVAVAVVALLSFLYFSSLPQVLIDAKKGHQNRVIAGQCLELIHFFDSSFDDSSESSDIKCLDMMYPRPSEVRIRAEKLGKLGFREFPENIPFITSENSGKIDLSLINDQMIILSDSKPLSLNGWTSLSQPTQNRPLVLLSYNDNKSFFTNAMPVTSSKANEGFKWKAKIFPKDIPQGESTIKAWVYDQKNQQFIKLKGEVKINNLVNPTPPEKSKPG